MKAKMKPNAYQCSPLGLEILPDTITFENRNDIQALLEKLFSTKFRFFINGAIKKDGTFHQGLTVLEYYKVHNPSIPTEDIVVVPHAFFGSYRNAPLFFDNPSEGYDNDIPLKSGEGETAISIWIKEHPKPTPPVKKLYRCPYCSDTLTEEEYLRSFEGGGNGYCGCRFSAKDEHGNVWYPREYVEYEVFTREEN